MDNSDRLRKALEQAAREGRPARLFEEPWKTLAPDAVVPGEVVRRLIIGDHAPSGVQISGATIVGAIDLQEVRGPGGSGCNALLLDSCTLVGNPESDEPDLDTRRGHIGGLSLINCAFTTIRLAGSVIEGSVNLAGSHPLNDGIECRVRARDVSIGGSFGAARAHFGVVEQHDDAGDGETPVELIALDLLRGHIGGTVLLTPDVHVNGLVVLDGLTVDGDLTMHAAVTGDVFAREMRVAGSLDLTMNIEHGGDGGGPGYANVVNITGSSVTGTTRLAVWFHYDWAQGVQATNCRFGSDVSTHVRGAPTYLAGGQFTADLLLIGDSRAPMKMVDATNIRVAGSLRLEGVIAGQVDASAATISGNLDLGGENWLRLVPDAAEPPQILLSGTTVTGTLRANPITTEPFDGVEWRTAQVVGIRIRRLACYREWQLGQIQVRSGSSSDVAVASFLIRQRPNRIVVRPLRGDSNSFHTINISDQTSRNDKSQILVLDDEDQLHDYVAAFCDNLWAGHSSFRLDPSTWHVSRTAADANDWFVRTYMYFQGQRARTSITVTRDGQLTMKTDQVVAHETDQELGWHKPYRWIRPDGPRSGGIGWPEYSHTNLDAWQYVHDDDVLWSTIFTAFREHDALQRLSHVISDGSGNDAPVNPTLRMYAAMARYDRAGVADARKAGADLSTSPVDVVNQYWPISRITSSEPRPVIDLSHARVGELDDHDGLNWSQTTPISQGTVTKTPSAVQLRLNGFEYGRIHERSTENHDLRLKTRLAFLSAQYSGEVPNEEEYSPQPYQHLARVLRTNGDYRSADAVTIEKLRIERLALTRGHMFVSARLFQIAKYLSLELPFGYGLKPRNALLTFLLLWAVGATAVFAVAPLVVNAGSLGTVLATQTGANGVVFTAPVIPVQSTSGEEEVPCSGKDAALYALDTIIPVIDLGYESTCRITSASTPEAEVWRFIWSGYAILGWIVTSGLILTASGIVRRQVEK